MVSKLQDISWIKESTFKTDPVSTGSEVLTRFGKYGQSWGKFPEEKSKFFQNLFGGNNYSNILSRVEIDIAVADIAVHGLNLMLAIADASGNNISNAAVGGGIYSHALTRRTDGNDPQSVMVRTKDQDTGGDRTDYDHHVGCVVPELTHTYDDTLNNGMLTEVNALKAIKSVAPAANPTPSYPNSDSTHYRRDANLAFVWDNDATTGDDHDLADYLKYFFIDIQNVITPIPDLSQATPFYDIYNYGARSLISGNFKILRGPAASAYVWDDYVTNKRAGTNTKYDFQFRIYKNANEYIDYQLDDCSFFVQRNHADIANNDMPVWDVNFVADSFTITVADQLNSANYWGAV